MTATIATRRNPRNGRTEYRAYPQGVDHEDGGAGGWYADRTQAEQVLAAATTAPGTVTCDECGATHIAEYSHEGQFGQGPIYAVVCGDLTDYYTGERVSR
jgi:hypothetical protein